MSLAPTKASIKHLPYGIWVCADGTTYLFNRSYTPLWKKERGQFARKLDGNERIDFISEFFLWTDDISPRGNSGVRASMETLLASFRERV